MSEYNNYNNEISFDTANEISIKDLYSKFKEWINYLKSKWIIICLFGIIGGTAGFIYAYNTKIIYKATLTFALEDEQGSAGGLGGALGLASSFGFDLGQNVGGAFSGANLIEFMKSRKVVGKALMSPIKIGDNYISLLENYLIITNRRQDWEKIDPAFNRRLKFYPNSDVDKFSLLQDSILNVVYKELLKNKLVVSQKDKKVSIFSIDVLTEDDFFSKYLAEALIKEVSDFYIETKSKKARINVEILSKQADSIRFELNNSITGVALANDKTYNLNPAYNIKRVPSTKKEIDVQANVAILTQLVANLEIAKVSLRKETPLIQLIDKPHLPLEKQKLSRSTSLIMGFFLMAFLSSLFLILKKQVSKILKD